MGGPCRDRRPGGPLRSEDQTVMSSPVNRTASREEENQSHRERNVVTASEPCQPGAQMLPAGRRDLATPHLPGHSVEIVERQLLPVDIQPAYDGRRDLLKLRRGRTRPHAKCLCGQA